MDQRSQDCIPPDLHRREFVGGAIAAVAAMAGCGTSAAAQTAAGNAKGLSWFEDYSQLLETLRSRGHVLRELGFCPDGSPLVAIQAGGTKDPAIFITAGSHSTEHAGVVAAVELLDELQTSRRLFVIPTRDPIGLSGFRHALSQGLGKVPSLSSVEEAEQLLRTKGEVLFDRDGRLLALIGDYGYANTSFYRKQEQGESFLEPLKGRRMYFPSSRDDSPGAAPLARAYTQVVTPEGEVLHLNRFHDTIWAPVEVRCTRDLMAEIKPGLVFDLHEYGGEDFWMSARRQRTPEDELWELRMAREAARAVTAIGATMAKEDYNPGSFFEKLEPGVFWLDPAQRGEGLNLIDFAARHYGPGFTVETGMRQDFRARVAMHKTVVKTAVGIYESREL